MKIRIDKKEARLSTLMGWIVLSPFLFCGSHLSSDFWLYQGQVNSKKWETVSVRKKDKQKWASK